MQRPRRIRKAGIYALSDAEYHGDPCAKPSLSRSIALKLVEPYSPAHAWLAHPRLNKSAVVADDPTKAQDVGTAAHSAFLQGENVIAEFAFPSWKSDAATARRNAARLAGKVPLLSKDAENVRGMLSALYTFRATTGAFTDGETEQTLIWHERDGAITCRARVDFLPNDPTAHLLDLKTTGGLASPAIWRGRAAEFGADLQAVMYPRGAAYVRNRTPAGMLFVVVEEHPPHGIRVFAYDGEAQAIATARYEAAVDTWAACMASGVWPGYDPSPVFLEASYNARQQWGGEAKAEANGYGPTREANIARVLVAGHG